MTHDELAQGFHDAMHHLYNQSKVHIRDVRGYVWNGSYFTRGLRAYGGLVYAKRLLQSRPNGFSLPIAQGYPNLTVEALVLTPPWDQLFTEKERETARTRLIASFVKGGHSDEAARMKLQQITSGEPHSPQ